MTSAAKLERLKLQWGYEDRTPRCSNCAGWRKPSMDPVASTVTPATCSKGGFVVRADGCCDKWSDKRSGERLQS